MLYEILANPKHTSSCILITLFCKCLKKSMSSCWSSISVVPAWGFLLDSSHQKVTSMTWGWTVLTPMPWMGNGECDAWRPLWRSWAILGFVFLKDESKCHHALNWQAMYWCCIYRYKKDDRRLLSPYKLLFTSGNSVYIKANIPLPSNLLYREPSTCWKWT